MFLPFFFYFIPIFLLFSYCSPILFLFFSYWTCPHSPHLRPCVTFLFFLGFSYISYFLLTFLLFYSYFSYFSPIFLVFLLLLDLPALPAPAALRYFPIFPKFFLHFLCFSYFPSILFLFFSYFIPLFLLFFHYFSPILFLFFSYWTCPHSPRLRPCVIFLFFLGPTLGFFYISYVSLKKNNFIPIFLLFCSYFSPILLLLDLPALPAPAALRYSPIFPTFLLHFLCFSDFPPILFLFFSYFILIFLLFSLILLLFLSCWTASFCGHLQVQLLAHFVARTLSASWSQLVGNKCKFCGGLSGGASGRFTLPLPRLIWLNSFKAMPTSSSRPPAVQATGGQRRNSLATGKFRWQQEWFWFWSQPGLRDSPDEYPGAFEEDAAVFHDVEMQTGAGPHSPHLRPCVIFLFFLGFSYFSYFSPILFLFFSYFFPISYKLLSPMYFLFFSYFWKSWFF